MKHYATIIGAFLGGLIGLSIGQSLHQPAVWLPLGVGLGLAIGVEIAERHKRNLICHPERSEVEALARRPSRAPKSRAEPRELMRSR